MQRRNTTDDTPTELTIDGATPAAGNRFLLDDESTITALIQIVAREDTGGDQAEFTRKVMIERTGGTTALVGSVQTIGTDIGSNAGSPPAGWTVTILADDTNDSLTIDVVGGIATTNVRWLAAIQAVELEYAD